VVSMPEPSVDCVLGGRMPKPVFANVCMYKKVCECEHASAMQGLCVGWMHVIGSYLPVYICLRACKPLLLWVTNLSVFVCILLQG